MGFSTKDTVSFSGSKFDFCPPLGYNFPKGGNMDNFHEYDRYDGLGVAELVRRKGISPAEREISVYPREKEEP